MFCETNGASIQSDCVCDASLYYDDRCVNPDVVAQMACELEESSGPAPVFHGWWAQLGASMAMVALAANML